MKANRRIFAHSFPPAASPMRIGRDIRSWTLHHRSDKSLTELAQMYNPCIRGWIAYYSHFYRTQLRPTLKRIDAYVIRWARRERGPRNLQIGDMLISAAPAGEVGESERRERRARGSRSDRAPVPSRSSSRSGKRG